MVIAVVCMCGPIVLQRKFVRLSEDDRSATHTVFRQWLGSASISEEDWSSIMDEDEAFDYLSLGVGQVASNEDQSGPALGAEQEVETEIAEGDNEYDNDDSI